MVGIVKLTDFLNQRFPVLTWKEKMKDRCMRPQIPRWMIAQSVIEMVPRMQTSLLEVDQAAREDWTKAYYGSHREMVASDTTMFRSLGEFHLAPIHDVLWEIARTESPRRRTRIRLPSGREWRMGIMDGSEWGSFPGSVLTLVGKRVDVVAGYRMSPGKGHELATTRALQREAKKELGCGFVDVMVGDGLYFTEEDFRWSMTEGGYHLVVKTREKTLEVIQDAEGIFSGDPKEFATSIEKAAGFDSERGCRYEILAVGGCRWRGMTFKVARVHEEYAKPKPNHPKEVTYWVVTTAVDLSVEDLREIVILRWHIENRTFRRLSHLVDSKRHLTHDEHTREALLGLWFIGLNLFGLVLAWTRMMVKGSIFEPMKKTWQWFAQRFERMTWQYGMSVKNGESG